MPTMKAARFHGARDVRFEDIPIPTLKPDHVLVDVEWCGICGSDLHEFESGPLAIPTRDRPHPLTGEHVPVVMGHEFCGTVRESNEGSGWKVGQRVTVDPRLLCRNCDSCQSGRDNQCPIIGSLGVTGVGGGLSEVVLVQERMLHAVPDDVPLVNAVLAEPLSVAHHAVRRAGIEDWEGQNVLVVGGGPVAYAVVLSLRAVGVRSIFVSEPTETRRRQIGFLVDNVIDSKIEDVGERCRAMTNGKGVDVAFDCAGVQQGLDAAVDALGYNGVWVNVSVWGGPMIPPFGPFLTKELTLRTSMVYSSEDFFQVMENLRNGRYPGLEKMVTARISLEDVVSLGLKKLAESREGHIKIVVRPREREPP